jgi:hypothetical protein
MVRRIEEREFLFSNYFKTKKMKRFYKTNRKSWLISTLLVLFSFVGYSDNNQPAETLAIHYTTVWQGENGVNHMNFMVISAILEDLPLSVNDEIAVFSGTKCVGAKKLAQVINPADYTTFLNIAASQDDGTGNGFAENDTVIFKIWDNANQREMVAKAITYRTDEPIWQTNGKYSAGATSVVEIVSFVEVTQTISLIKGYNMFSLNVAAANMDVTSVTNSLTTEGSLVKVQDETGKSYENWGIFGGWKNGIGSISKTEGYKIKVASNTTLQITGRPIVLPLEIPLIAGWNIISFPHTIEVNAMSVVQALIDQNLLLKVQDEAGNSIENWGIFGGWKNGIGNFKPGKAYKVKTSGNATLTIQANYLKSALVATETSKSEYFSTAFEGNGIDQMNINLVGLKDAGLKTGDEIAAFDGDICVGTLKITEANLLSGASIVASYSTDSKVLDGFTDGHSIQLIAWNQFSGSEYQLQAEAVNGQLVFDRNSSVFATLKSATPAAKGINNELQVDVFPNPSVGKINVRFSGMAEPDSRIDVLDLSGRIVASRKITGTTESFDLSSAPRGIYLVKAVMGSSEIVQKLIVQ